MARPLRLPVADGVYHVVARGNAKQRIYLDSRDFRTFAGILRDVLSRFEWRCLTYCLMPNHYHLVLRTLRANLSRGMRQINGVYAQRFNRRHDRCGHLFQGRFKAVLVQPDRHLLQLARYVALNPVRAGLCESVDDWPWSGHRDLMGSPGLGIATKEFLTYFGNSIADARIEYDAFVRAGDIYSVEESGVILGDSAYVSDQLPEPSASAEIPRAHRQKIRPPLEEILDVEDLDLAIATAYRAHGYLMREIAEALGCHYATVSRRIRRFEGRAGTARAA
jgi:putative transposase